MAYAFARAEGFAMITGQPGTGKTTLVADVIDSLADERVTVGKLVSTQLAPDDLLRMVAYEFGLDAQNLSKAVILQQLTGLFRGYKRDSGRALLIVDEAQILAPESLEELRLLTNLQQDGEPLLQIFLLGQSELRDMVHSPELEQVHQRIVAASHMKPLMGEEIRAYVECRLRNVGWDNDPQISSAVYPIIFKFSEGVPRRINLICSRLFLHACVAQAHQITLETARIVVAELQEEQLSTRNLLNEDEFNAEDRFEAPLAEKHLVSVTNKRAAHTVPKQRSHHDSKEANEPKREAGVPSGVEPAAGDPFPESDAVAASEKSITGSDQSAETAGESRSRPPTVIDDSRNPAYLPGKAVVAAMGVVLALTVIAWQLGMFSFL